MQRLGMRASGGAASLPNADSHPTGSGWAAPFGRDKGCLLMNVTFFAPAPARSAWLRRAVLPVGTSTTSSGASIGLASRSGRAPTHLSPFSARLTIAPGLVISSNATTPRTDCGPGRTDAQFRISTAASAPDIYVERLDTAPTCLRDKAARA